MPATCLTATTPATSAADAVTVAAVPAVTTAADAAPPAPGGAAAGPEGLQPEKGGIGRRQRPKVSVTPAMHQKPGSGMPPMSQ